ncbi:hypothetical protein [Novosphingobium sp. EMRT-2]|uniref:hypothetical protein n=1 Tax=Novosphingobium sp. EMRT-2 TaxID=2571749 RepID=UPI0010BDC938|nr:hypothetical protein [Novosphingobium sp. EMRT-2]QCI94843.1 hypothetical protein FA702_15840 [Novosphingobium sp. EMRT-2]
MPEAPRANAFHHLPRRLTTLVVLTCLASGCAGPVRTRFGGMAAPEKPAMPYTVKPTAMPDDNGDRSVIVDALRTTGIGIADDSRNELTAAYTQRPSNVAVLVDNAAPPLSGAKKQRFLQSCHDTRYRLVLTVVDHTTGTLIGRGWAEEDHCHGTGKPVLASLAARAADMLVHPVPEGSELSWTRD